jgi:hypothetical protein
MSIVDMMTGPDLRLRHGLKVICHFKDHDWQVESMLRNGSWQPAPSYPKDWVGRRPSVRARCARCASITTKPIA